MNKLLNNAKKPLVFCLAATIGCFTFALLAELFLFLTQKESGQPAQEICLTIDVSGSMAGDKMDETKRAAKSFVGKQNLSKDSVALVIFSSVGKVFVPFTHNKSELNEHIDKLLPYGGTNFEDAMKSSEQVFDDVISPDVVNKTKKVNTSILLFTDGAPSIGDSQKALDIAYSLRKKGVKIISVATEDGDMPYLVGLTGKEDRVIAAADGKIEEAFAQAESAMKQSLMGSGSSSTSMAFVQASGWSVFLCLGIVLALVAVQNYFLKKPLLPPKQLPLIVIGSVAAGIASGLIGETSHQIFDVVNFGVLGQVVGWTVLGAALVFGMVYLIPNMNKIKALLFGAIGGFLGSIAFLILSFVSPIGGRLIGAAILGACIGLLVAIVEMLYRNVWLMVVFDPRNLVPINLGSQAVTIGSDTQNTVVIPNSPPKTGSFKMDGNNIRYDGPEGKQTLQPGDRVRIGKVELVICSKDIPFSPSKFYPMRMSKVPR